MTFLWYSGKGKTRGDRNEICGYQQVGEEVESDCKWLGGILEIKKMFNYLDFSNSDFNTFAKTHWTVHLAFVDFIVHK